MTLIELKFGSLGPTSVSSDLCSVSPSQGVSILNDLDLLLEVRAAKTKPVTWPDISGTDCAYYRRSVLKYHL